MLVLNRYKFFNRLMIRITCQCGLLDNLFVGKVSLFVLRCPSDGQRPRKSISLLTIDLKVFLLSIIFFTKFLNIFNELRKMNNNFKLHFLFNYRMRHIFIIQKRFPYLLIIFQFHIYIHFQWSLKNIYEQ